MLHYNSTFNSLISKRVVGYRKLGSWYVLQGSNNDDKNYSDILNKSGTVKIFTQTLKKPPICKT